MSLEEKVESEPAPPKFKPYSERSDLELFGGVYNAIKNRTMNYGTLEAEILELIESLKKDPVIRRNLQHYDKTNAQLNYYSSDLVADLLQIGFVEHWCLHPETLEFVYRHGHYYLISSDACVNHDRMDIWRNVLNYTKNDPEFVDLYLTETPLKRKLEICKEYGFPKYITASYYDSPEDCSEAVAYCKQNFWILDKEAWDPKYNDNDSITDYIKSILKTRLGFTINDIIERDNLELFKFVESIYGKDLVYSRFLEYGSPNVCMGVKIATYLGRSGVRELTSRFGYQIRLTKAAFESINISFVSITCVTENIKAWWHSIHIPGLNLRQKYYRLIYMHITKENNFNTITQLIGSRIAMEYFVSDSKTAIKSKTDMIEVYLTIQKHPIMLKKYLSLGLTPDFVIEDVHIQSVIDHSVDTDLMKRIYRLGFGKLLPNVGLFLPYPKLEDVLFLCLVIDPNLANKIRRDLLIWVRHKELAKHLEKHIKK